MSDANIKKFEIELTKNIKANYDNVGRAIVEQIKFSMDANIQRSGSPLLDTITHKVEGDHIKIYADPIVGFLDRGTKPHIIRPKRPGGALAFKANQVVTRKNGTKIGFGETVITKEVKHPGIREMEFISQALFLFKKNLGLQLFSSAPYKK